MWDDLSFTYILILPCVKLRFAQAMLVYLEVEEIFGKQAITNDKQNMLGTNQEVNNEH